MMRLASNHKFAVKLLAAGILVACTNMKSPVDPPVQVNTTVNVGAPGAQQPAPALPVYTTPIGQVPIYTAPGTVIQQPVTQQPVTTIGGQLPYTQPTLPPPAVIPTPVPGGVYATVTEIVSGNNRFARVTYDIYNKTARTNLPFGWLGATLVPYDETFTGFLETWSGVTVRGTQVQDATRLVVDYDITVIPVNSTNGSWYNVQASVPQGQIPAISIPRVWIATRINNVRAINTPGRIQIITDPTDPNKETFRF